MKAFRIISKIVVALAAVAGIAYIVVNYGDRIVAWFKKTFSNMCCCGGECCCQECDCAEEDEAPEIAAEEGAVIAVDADFEG